jgi:PAS domain S-box-containing protein
MDGSRKVDSALTELVEDAPCGIVMTDADGRLLFVNDTLKRWLNLAAAGGVCGQRLPDLMVGPGRIFYETHVAPMMHLQGFAREISCFLKVTGGDALPVLLSGVARRNGEGKLIRCDYTIFDARERRIYEEELRLARVKADELAAIVRTSPNAIFRVNDAGQVRSANAGAETLLRTPAEQMLNQPVQDLVHFATPCDWFDRAKALCSCASEAVLETTDAEGRHFELTVVPIGEAAEDASMDFSVVLRDITARKKAEQRLKVALGEMKHRVKNTLAVVAGIARQTLPTEIRDAFIGRMQALSRAHDVLAADKHELADVRDLLDLAAAEAGGEDRLRISGAQHLTLPPEHAQSLSMALHELATNALKYGALSEPGGYITVECELVGENLLRMVWQERDGPPVSPPSRQGFGSKMINTLLKFDLGAEVRIDYNPEGLRCEIEFEVGS